MVSSALGSPTNTCWKRRSRAGSFSMRSRYSSSVVAPIIRSSPRASIGLSMLPASIALSPPAPAPTTVCSSSMNVMIWPSLSLISASTALRRSSNSPRYLAPATIAAEVERDQPAAAQRLRHVAGDDALGEPLDDGGLADAGLADEHRVVLGAAAQHLHDAADLGVAADDRVELAVAGDGGQVDAVLLQRLVGVLGVGAGDARAAADRRERGLQGVGGGAGAGEDRAARATRRWRCRPPGARSRRSRRRAGRPGPGRAAAPRGSCGTASGCRRWRRTADGRRPSSSFSCWATTCGSTPAAAEQRHGGAARLGEQGVEQVGGLHGGIAGRRGSLDGRGQRLLAARGVGREVHGSPGQAGSDDGRS